MLSEDQKIKTRRQLKEWLAVENWRYPLSARRILPYLLQISEGAILRRHTRLLRTTEYHVNTGHRIRAALYHAMLMRIQMRTGIHIPLNSCAKGLTIYHVQPGGLNGNATAGENLRLMPGAIAIGDDKTDLAPTIGDNVTLGPNCILVGGITLADNITVGAGAVVTHSFTEPGITIAGVPARKIRGPEPENGGAADAD